MSFFRRGSMHRRRGFLGRIRNLYETTIFRRADPAPERTSPVIAPAPFSVASSAATSSIRGTAPLDVEPTIDLDQMLWMLDEVLERANLRETGSKVESVDINALLAALVTACDATRICVERAPWPVHVRAKPFEIRRLFATLVARALADSTRTIIRLDRGTSAMVAHFDDNGPGVSHSARDDLFVFSADRHPAENALATAWQMASALGGDIRVSSSPEGGARFTVRLPTICESEIAFAAAS